jgi:GH15 family glucan-1,4-alpha-glucosidase
LSATTTGPAVDRARAGDRYPPIGDYAAIGDSRSVALVSREGSIDWLCLPRFDSPPIFGAPLDASRGGRFSVRPVGPFRSTSRYLADTNVLETTLVTPDGAVALRDVMAVASEAEKEAQSFPEHHLLREIEGIAGAVDVEVLYEPRPDFARQRPRLERRGALGIWNANGSVAFALRSDLPLTLVDDRTTVRARQAVRAGARAHLSFTYTREAPAVIPPLGLDAQAVVERAARWWRGWTARCSYRGPYRDAVVRSALALKLLTYAPSGAVVAAPTTSLPEWIGGGRNWDYRFCWLRDASLTVRALFALGYPEEAEAFLGWMLHATRLTWPRLQVMYDVFGESSLPERELPHLEGYAGSQPVRVGNGAHRQVQLDVYGEVVDAVSQFVERGGRLDRDTQGLLDGLGHTVCRMWREPDAGIWESRADAQHYTHSKVLCWVALDRLVRMHDRGQIQVCGDTFRTERDAIRAEVEEHGFNPRLNSYTQTYGGETVDAGLLTLPMYGYVDAAHPRMRGTIALVRDRLGRGPLIDRYQLETDGVEGAFGICSFWAVESLALGGDVAEAEALFEQLLAYANDVGLFAEEIDSATGAALGNFPQAFTHVGLINAALTLEECRHRARRPSFPDPSTALAVGGSRL